ncbi:hypothetical protein AFULGI_00016770 [Archaeoglobus fulgidus DSM 8774]|uniref:Uncharacterized protein n=1 Tax=Archaeoglobus fulgidus DSM 8774 TaxID=1344584 RepID=A0A075WEL2_ARCFL|nr:ATP-dependent endonuclease [Archaeoglobus fulgidus]AIG98436.1 hypothetical protein AFULGI_00016770 [Archaeoglobus fulgidus DSM 8774]
MKLRWLRIRGFKSVRELTLDIDDFLCFVGQNNHGKSNVFYALELFFSPYQSAIRKLNREMFYKGPAESANEIIIECRFEQLSDVEIEKLRDWVIDGTLTISKRYWIDEDNKPHITYYALIRVPKEEWLRKNYGNYNNREIVSKLPIAKFLPKTGRISREAYNNAIEEFLQKYSNEIEWIEELEEIPRQVIDRLLPEFYLVPAVRDITEETKTTGHSLLSRVLSVIIKRIAEQNPAFHRLQKTVQEIKTVIEGKTPDEKLEEIRELEEKLTQELKHWNVGLSIHVEAPDIEKLFQLGTTIVLDDGIPTSVSEKGHGLQRALLFALLRVWAAELKRMQAEGASDIRERSHIFAFEEPELFLHPQVARLTYESLKEISQTDQIFICTHSPHFINIEDYRHIVIIKKPDLETGTKAHRVQNELFEGDSDKKRRFNMIQFFNPDRNELFFARKVVLVEGPTEKAVLPLLGRRIGCFDHSVSIIDCGGKFNLTLYITVLNAFRIPYLVIHDEDPIDPELQPGGSRYNPDKLKQAVRTYQENERIKEVVDPEIGEIIVVEGEFEDLLGVSRSQAEKLGKPLAAVEKYSNEDVKIPEDLKKIVIKVYE